MKGLVVKELDRKKYRRVLIFASIGIFIAALFGLARATGYIEHKSLAVLKQGEALEQSNPNKAIVDYQIALFLSPQNEEIINHLANLYWATSRSNSAIAILKRLPIEVSGIKIAKIQLEAKQYQDCINTTDKLLKIETSIEALIIKSKALLELGNLDEAISVMRVALADSPSNLASQIQLGSIYALENKNSELSALIKTASNSQVVIVLNKFLVSKLVLAQTFYNQGLLLSAEKALSQCHDENAQRYILLAKIQLAAKKPTAQALQSAREALEKVIVLTPANIEARIMLKDLYIKLGDQAKATEQNNLIKQLQNGNI